MTANAKAVSTRLEPSRNGQRAHDLRLGPQPEYVDKKRSHLNRTLLEPLTNDALKDEWHEVKNRIGKKGKIRSNQNLSYAGIVTFGHEAQKIFETLSEDQQDAAFLEVGEKIAERFNTRLTGMVFHRDETAPHCHFQLRGIADDGTMLSQVMKRGALREVQDITAEAMSRYAEGIERGKDKWVRIEEGEDFASTVNRSVQQLHEDLPAEIAAKEAELVAAQDKLQANLDRLAKAAQKATEEGAKAEKARKRAETYERRVSTAREDVANLETILEDLRKRRTALEANNRALDKALAQKKTNVTSLRAKKAALEARLKALSAA